MVTMFDFMHGQEAYKVISIFETNKYKMRFCMSNMLIKCHTFSYKYHVCILTFNYIIRDSLNTSTTIVSRLIGYYFKGLVELCVVVYK